MNEGGVSGEDEEWLVLSMPSSTTLNMRRLEFSARNLKTMLPSNAAAFDDATSRRTPLPFINARLKELDDNTALMRTWALGPLYQALFIRVARRLTGEQFYLSAPAFVACSRCPSGLRFNVCEEFDRMCNDESFPLYQDFVPYEDRAPTQAQNYRAYKNTIFLSSPQQTGQVEEPRFFPSAGGPGSIARITAEMCSSLDLAAVEVHELLLREWARLYGAQTEFVCQWARAKNPVRYHKQCPECHGFLIAPEDNNSFCPGKEEMQEAVWQLVDGSFSHTPSILFILLSSSFFAYSF